MNENQPPRRRSLLKIIFLSPSEPRLRAGWRLLLQVMMQIVLTLATSVGLLLAPRALATRAFDFTSPAGLALSELAQVGTVTLSVFLARRLLDRRSFVSIGLQPDRRALVDLAAGIGITFVMMAWIFAAEWRLGWLRLEGFSWTAEPPGEVGVSVLAFFGIFVLVGWSEELMSRGYHLQTIASGLNISWGLILSSAVFGVLHLANPHASWIGAAGIFFAGIFLGYAFFRTGQLWLPIGLHIGWNFFEGVVFGFPVSGLSVYQVAHISVSGPELWTGGNFGPEAGLVVLPAILVGLGLIRAYTRGHARA